VAVSPRRELCAFAAVLAAIVGGFFAQSLFGGRILSPADVFFTSGSFAEVRGPNYEPANRLLIDPVLQFQPWLEFNRTMLRSGRLPLWNPMAGCGAPHLANGQSAVFDPFHLIAYLGELPDALSWMAAARLWFAGFGMFLLAKAWEFGPWGRWFSGLAFPFCGFLVAWLLFPVTNVAIWMPWAFLATERVFDRPSCRRVGCLALVVGGTLLGGHVQTSAHVLLAVGAYASWKWWSSPGSRRGLMAWSVGIGLGLAIAAIEVVPLGFYLAKSPVWGDRERERTSPWTMARPRLLDAACTALPYLYGSQRRGQPNLAKAVGVNNLNESAGGFAGLATLIWLAPLAWSARRVQPRVRFLVGLTAFGLLGAFRLPPVDNLLRALPVLGVTDNRRLTLWVAFGLVALGGIGIDRLAAVRRSRAWSAWGWAWVVGSVALLAAAGGLERLAPTIRARANEHYSKALESTPGADRDVYRARAERQARETLDFVPHYLGLAATQGLVLAWLLRSLRRGRISDDSGRAALLGLTMVDLLGFGFGLNPAIDRADDRPSTPVLAALRREVGSSSRIIGLGAELPPNTLMRYGLADARNYDSVEVSRSLEWFAPLYEPGAQARTSRREITWPRVLDAQDRLFEASVRAVVGPTHPPSGFDHVEKIGAVWVAWLDSAPLIQIESGGGALSEVANEPGRIVVDVDLEHDARLIIRQTFDRGWRAEIDERSVEIEPHLGAFLAARVEPGKHRLAFIYDAVEVRVAWIVSSIAVLAAVFALTDLGPFRFTRIVLRRLGRTQAIGLESDL
jgi:hypothetical protein